MVICINMEFLDTYHGWNTIIFISWIFAKIDKKWQNIRETGWNV